MEARSVGGPMDMIRACQLLGLFASYDLHEIRVRFPADAFIFGCIYHYHDVAYTANFVENNAFDWRPEQRLLAVFRPHLYLL